MLNSGAAVQSFLCEPSGSGTAACTVTVHGCGSLALYSTAAPASCTVDGMPVSAEYDAERCIATLPVRQTDDLDTTVELSFAL